jgi:putative transposase
MALPQSALSELLEAFRAGDGVDLIRESVRMVLQELIEAEAAEVIGAPLRAHPRTGSPSATASRPKLVTTKAGDVSCGSPSCARARSSPRSSSPAAGSTRRCTRW